MIVFLRHQRIDYYATDVNMLNCCCPRSHQREKKSVAYKGVKSRISNSNAVEIVRVNLDVPPIPPTDFESSKVVKVTYYLSVSMN